MLGPLVGITLVAFIIFSIIFVFGYVGSSLYSSELFLRTLADDTSTIYDPDITGTIMLTGLVVHLWLPFFALCVGLLKRPPIGCTWLCCRTNNVPRGCSGAALVAK